VRAFPLVVVGLALTVAACASSAEREMSREQAIAKDSSVAWRQCVADAGKQPAVAALSGKVVLLMGVSRPTLAQRSDDTKPTPEERQSLVEAYDRWAVPCRDKAISAAISANPDYSRPLNELRGREDQIFGALAEGSLTWGNGNVALGQARDEAKTAVDAVAAQKGRDLQRQATQENAQRSAALQTLGQSMTNYGAYIQTMQPRTTNCWYVGNMLNCTTY
jgi:hypothetical protein